MKTLSFKYFTALVTLSAVAMSGAASHAMMQSEYDGNSVHSQTLPSVEVNLHVLGALRQSVKGSAHEKKGRTLAEKKQTVDSKKKTRHAVAVKKSKLPPVKVPAQPEATKPHHPPKVDALPMLAPKEIIKPHHAESHVAAPAPHVPEAKAPKAVMSEEALPVQAAGQDKKMPAPVMPAPVMPAPVTSAPVTAHESEAMIPFPKGGVAPSATLHEEEAAVPLTPAPTMPPVSPPVDAAPLSILPAMPSVTKEPALPKVDVPEKPAAPQDKKGFLSRILGSKETPTIEVPSKPAEEVSGPAKSLSVQSVGGTTKGTVAPVAPPAEADMPAMPPLPTDAVPEALSPSDLPPADAKSNAHLSSLSFQPGEVSITPLHSNQLSQLVADLSANPEHKLRVIAHTASDAQNDTKVRRIALQRVIAIRKHLIDQGVSPLQINVQALASADGAKASASQENVEFELIPIGS
jgi:outer membrane protein OmpA-like peptidoglycan-associated protein